jgi:hypothetical protein
MRIYEFEIETEEDLIIVIAKIGEKSFLRLGLDTAATHTTIDSNMLFLAGYYPKNSLGATEVETSNGVVLVEQYSLQRFESLGFKNENFIVQAYDFLAHGITSNYHGLLGMIKYQKTFYQKIKGFLF